MTTRRTIGAIAALLFALPLVGCGEDEKADAPEQEAPRTVDDAVVNDARFECLQREGIAVTRGANGSVDFKDPEDTMRKELKRAEDVCEKELADKGLVEAVSTDSLREEYGRMSRLHACLVAASFPLKEWVSEEVFVQKEGAFNVLDATGPTDLDAAQSACPDEFAAIDQP